MESATPKQIPSLTVVAFHDLFRIEAYLFEDDSNNDADTMQLYKHSQSSFEWDNYEERDPLLTHFHLVAIVSRRISGSIKNEVMYSKRNCVPRKVMIRLLPQGTHSTQESRKEGLQQLQSYLLRERRARFDYHLCSYSFPDGILLRDITRTDDPWPLDVFFMDCDMKHIMVHFLAGHGIRQMNIPKNFYREHFPIARKCWSGVVYSEWAKKLGFPTFAS